MTRRLLNVQEVAEHLGFSTHTVYTMVSQKRIPHIKIGKLVRFNPYELDRWIASHSVKARRALSILTPP